MGAGAAEGRRPDQAQEGRCPGDRSHLAADGERGAEAADGQAAQDGGNGHRCIDGPADHRPEQDSTRSIRPNPAPTSGPGKAIRVIAPDIIPLPLP
jgi:hypothetical protein